MAFLLSKIQLRSGLDKWLQINTEYADKWPNITVAREAPEDAKAMDGIPDKFVRFFSAEPGQGD